MARSIVLAVTLLLAPAGALAQSCPEPLASARRLVLVIAGTMNSRTATVRRFTRASGDARWRAVGGPASALIGRKGLAWAYSFRAVAHKGEPIKIEGDKRTPAGFFAIGAPFGFAASHRPGYLRIKSGTVCVDDARSAAYNTITSRAKIGWRVHGENMARVPAYRRGLLVDYPTNRAARAGSCIFIHLRLPKATGTVGCIALRARQLIAVQNFAQDRTALAVLPEQALKRFKNCLPTPSSAPAPGSALN